MTLPRPALAAGIVIAAAIVASFDPIVTGLRGAAWYVVVRLPELLLGDGLGGWGGVVMTVVVCACGACLAALGVSVYTATDATHDEPADTPPLVGSGLTHVNAARPIAVGEDVEVNAAGDAVPSVDLLADLNEVHERLVDARARVWQRAALDGAYDGVEDTLRAAESCVRAALDAWPA